MTRFNVNTIKCQNVAKSLKILATTLTRIDVNLT